MSLDVVVCPQCRTSLQNSIAVAAQIVACPQCGTQLQMPALAEPAAELPLSASDALPPAVQLPPPATPAGEPSRSVSSASGPIVRTTTRRKGARQGTEPSVADRLRRRSNPWTIFFAVTIAMLLVGFAVALYFWDQAEQAKEKFAKQMIGNWELVPGQTQLDRWDFAFHADGKLQMALGSELSEGRWKIVSAKAATGEVLIQWPDDAPETMRVWFENGTIRVELESVGNFVFRAATL